MQFHPTGTDPTSEARLVCRNARNHILMLLAIFWAIPAVWWYFQIYWIAYFCIALALGLTPLMFGSWRRRGRPDNWSLAVNRDSLWLNLRNVEYHTAEPGETVVNIPYPEIVAVRQSIHRYTTPSNDGSTNHKDVYLDILLNNQADQLREAVQAEQGRECPSRGCLTAGITVQTKRGPGPLLVKGDDIVRLKFSTKNYHLKPNLKTTLAELKKYVIVEPTSDEKTGDWQQLDQQQFNKLVEQLVAAGRTIDAVGLLRSRNKMSTTDAMNFIDELSKQLNQQKPS